MLRHFVLRSCAGQRALVREEWADAVAGALLEGRGCAPAGQGGRGALLRFEYPGGTGLIRRHLRGGVARHILRDAYLLHNRPLRELRLHAALYDEGLAVPQPLGAAWVRRGACFRGAIATAEVDAVDLRARGRSHGAAEAVLLRECGRLIRRMHDLGVAHADLQAGNILVGAEGPYLIDFDKAARRARLGRVQRARNLFRLRRSLEKNGLPADYFRLICEGYGPESLPAWVGHAYRVKGKLADLAPR